MALRGIFMRVFKVLMVVLLMYPGMSYSATTSSDSSTIGSLKAPTSIYPALNDPCADPAIQKVASDGTSLACFETPPGSGVFKWQKPKGVGAASKMTQSQLYGILDGAVTASYNGAQFKISGGKFYWGSKDISTSHKLASWPCSTFSAYASLEGVHVMGTACIGVVVSITSTTFYNFVPWQ